VVGRPAADFQQGLLPFGRIDHNLRVQIAKERLSLRSTSSAITPTFKLIARDVEFLRPVARFVILMQVDVLGDSGDLRSAV
jgi:hypothetical protein